MCGQSVLVVESDPGIRGLLAEILEDAGFVVLHAERGHEGLRLAERTRPSVVLVNHVLPDMSGLELLDLLRSPDADRHIPAVLMSGRAQQLDGIVSGADRVMSMPFDIGVLVAHVEQLAQAQPMPVA
jgi:adenylate cyclase